MGSEPLVEGFEVGFRFAGEMGGAVSLEMIAARVGGGAGATKEEREAEGCAVLVHDAFHVRDTRRCNLTFSLECEEVLDSVRPDRGEDILTGIGTLFLLVPWPVAVGWPFVFGGSFVWRSRGVNWESTFLRLPKEVMG